MSKFVKNLKKIRRKIRSFIYKNFVNKYKKPNENPSYTLVSYTDKNGNFDYDMYRQKQIAGNNRKLDVIWVSEANIKFLAQWLKKNMATVSFGICHGTRNGAEQKFFKKYLGNINVVGTEISNTANQFPDTIQWDFHDINPEFSQKADFVYSNSFDHAYDPEKALTAWLDALKPTGVCIIEHSSGHSPSAVNELDPFGADIEIMPALVEEWTKGKYEVSEIFDAPDIKTSLTYDKFIIITRATNFE